PQHIFNTLYHLPDPIPANNEHYKNFEDVYGTDTHESYCPSIQARKAKSDKNKKDDNILLDMESEEGEVSDEEFILVDNINTCTKRDDMDQKLRNVLSKVFVNAA
ncbi:13939_t:CDS:2, partial [Funneliformis mosseae]